MLLYITGGIGFLLAFIAIVLVTVFCIKSKSPIFPIILFALGFLLFMGSGFMHWKGVELKLPEKEKTDDVKQTEDQTPEAPKSDEPNGEDNSQVSEPAPDVTPEPDISPEPAPQSNSSGSIGNYYVEIKDAFVTTDYYENPAIVITYSWTNSSEDTTSAMSAFIERAYQDGIELERAIVSGESRYNSDDKSKNLRPGTSLDVQCAFCLRNEESTVEFEVSEFISFSDDIVSKNFDPSTLD